MDMNTLQYVVGEAKAGQPAVIRFFGRVTEETTSRFNDEFDFLENIIRHSYIRIFRLQPLFSYVCAWNGKRGASGNGESVWKCSQSGEESRV